MILDTFWEIMLGEKNPGHLTGGQEKSWSLHTGVKKNLAPLKTPPTPLDVNSVASLGTTSKLCLFLGANAAFARGKGSTRGCVRFLKLAFYEPKCMLFTFLVAVRKTSIIQKV